MNWKQKMLTIEELKEKIVEQINEVDLIDYLGLTSADLVEVFTDKIEDKFDLFLEVVEDIPSEDY